MCGQRRWHRRGPRQAGCSRVGHEPAMCQRVESPPVAAPPATFAPPGVADFVAFPSRVVGRTRFAVGPPEFRRSRRIRGDDSATLRRGRIHVQTRTRCATIPGCHNTNATNVGHVAREPSSSRRGNWMSCGSLGLLTRTHITVANRSLKWCVRLKRNRKQWCWHAVGSAPFSHRTILVQSIQPDRIAVSVSNRAMSNAKMHVQHTG